MVWLNGIAFFKIEDRLRVPKQVSRYTFYGVTDEFLYHVNVLATQLGWKTVFACPWVGYANTLLAPAVSHIITNKLLSLAWTLALMNVSCSLLLGPIRLTEALQPKTLLEILWQALTSIECLKGRFRTSWQLEHGVSTVSHNYCLLVSIVFWSDQGHGWEERVRSGKFWWPVDYLQTGLYHALLPPTLSNLSIPHHMPRFQISIP